MGNRVRQRATPERRGGKRHLPRRLNSQPVLENLGFTGGRHSRRCKQALKCRVDLSQAAFHISSHNEIGSLQKIVDHLQQTFAQPRGVLLA